MRTILATLLFLALTSTAHADEFDDKLKAEIVKYNAGITEPFISLQIAQESGAAPPPTFSININRSILWKSRVFAKSLDKSQLHESKYAVDVETIQLQTSSITSAKAFLLYLYTRQIPRGMDFDQIELIRLCIDYQVRGWVSMVTAWRKNVRLDQISASKLAKVLVMLKHNQKQARLDQDESSLIFPDLRHLVPQPAPLFNHTLVTIQGIAIMRSLTALMDDLPAEIAKLGEVEFAQELAHTFKTPGREITEYIITLKSQELKQVTEQKLAFEKLQEARGQRILRQKKLECLELANFIVGKMAAAAMSCVGSSTATEKISIPAYIDINVLQKAIDRIIREQKLKIEIFLEPSPACCAAATCGGIATAIYSLICLVPSVLTACACDLGCGKVYDTTSSCCHSCTRDEEVTFGVRILSG
jgi:hypothetical protein